MSVNCIIFVVLKVPLNIEPSLGIVPDVAGFKGSKFFEMIN